MNDATRPFQLLRRYLSTRRAGGLARGTLASQELYLRHFLSWLLSRGTRDVRRVTPADIEAYRLELVRHRYRRSKAEGAPWKSLQPKVRAERLGFVCTFFRWLVTAHVLVADPAASCVIVYPRHRLPKGLTEAEAEQLLEAPDPRTAIGLRDRAILALLYSSGLRRAEASALDLADVDYSSGTVLVRCGKGGKSRLAPIGASALETLAAYVKKARPDLVAPSARFSRKQSRSTALFIGLAKTAGQRLSPGAVSAVVLRAAERVGIQRRVMAHALRHSLATHLLRAGADIRHVQGILGHADVTATEIYTHVAIKDLADVHARSHPRGRLRATREPPRQSAP